MSGRPPNDTSFFVCSTNTILVSPLSRDLALARGPDHGVPVDEAGDPTGAKFDADDATRNIAYLAACSAAFRGATYPEELKARVRILPPFVKTFFTFHRSSPAPYTTCVSSFYSISARQCFNHFFWCCSVAKNSGSRITSYLLGKMDPVQVLERDLTCVEDVQPVFQSLKVLQDLHCAQEVRSLHIESSGFGCVCEAAFDSTSTVESASARQA